MIECKICGAKFPKFKEKYHEFQECKGYNGLDAGEDTIFALDYFKKINEEDIMLEKDEEMARKLQEEENNKAKIALKKKMEEKKKRKLI